MKKMNGTEVLGLIKTRRSVRKFTCDPVAPDAVDAMLEAAIWAPSASNRQSWKFVAVSRRPLIEAMAGAVRAAVERLASFVEPDDEDKLSLLKGYSSFFSFFDGAPLVIAVFFTPRPNFVNVLAGRQIRPEDNLEQASSAGAAIQNILLTAHSMGYAACWMSGPLLAEDEIAKLLGQKGMRLAALVPVGVPAETPLPPKRRDAHILIEKVI